MSQKANPWDRSQAEPPVPAAPVAETSTKVVESREQESEVRPIVIMTELDAIIHERMKAQPKSLEEVETRLGITEEQALHRLSLPEYFESKSYDCTRGTACRCHQRDDQGQVTNPGPYVFRWQYKEKRALDRAINVKGWLLVNRTYAAFQDAPKVLFSVNGGVEVGDSILTFMPVKQALAIRGFPAKRSQEWLRNRMSPIKGRPQRVLMTGDPEQEHVYTPDLSADESEVGEGSSAAPGSFQEGRNF